MEVKVKLFASLGKYAPDKEPAKAFIYEIQEDDTLRSLAKKIGIPEEEIKICFVNAHSRKMDHELAHNDEVGFFPPIGGG